MIIHFRAAIASAAAAMVLIGGYVQAAESRVRCDFYKQFTCKAQGCSDVTTQAWSIIDFDKSEYSICDAAKCEALKYVRWPDGIYVAFAFPSRELMVKVNMTDSSIVETSTYLNNSITSFGNCQADRN